MDIVITDLTRFKNTEIVCIAGIDLQTGQCIRPMPYIKSLNAKKLNLQPGSILRGEFTPSPNIDHPHSEDHNYSGLSYRGQCSPEDFRAALEITKETDLSRGFNYNFTNNSKVIPIERKRNISRSIVSIEINPKNFEIVEDNYNPGKIKAHFTDQSGATFRYISITDLGFFDHALEHHNEDDLFSLNHFIRRQPSLMLRVGLSRPYKTGDREGYWIQVNGIYTFPSFMHHLRGNIR